MKHSNPLARAATAGLAAATLGAGIAGVVHAKPAAPDVPDRIDVASEHEVFLVGHAVGVQIYSCNTAGDGFAWGPVAPRADIYNGKGKRILTHFGGPTWQANDGSFVIGQRVDGVTVDPSAIPWLLLSATLTGAGEDGERLADTTFIQRTATTGGLAPAPESCTAGTLGETKEVPYTADYHFWKKKND